MALILNPRGTAGAGKTTFVRRLMAAYGAGRRGVPEPILLPGRAAPIAGRLEHPAGGRPLLVLGHYERNSGGCDTIRQSDGGLREAFCLAERYVAQGHDILLEGLSLSQEHELSAALARAYPLHVLRLDTPPAQCARNLVRRRRIGKAAAVWIEPQIKEQRAALDLACERLRPWATIETLPFDVALERAAALLELQAKPALLPACRAVAPRKGCDSLPGEQLATS